MILSIKIFESHGNHNLFEKSPEGFTRNNKIGGKRKEPLNEV